MQKNVTSGRRKGYPNYPPEFKQQLVAASCEPGVSISKLALENSINANLLFKWRQQWREGKLADREREIDLLQAQLDKLHRMNFGSCSEKVSRRIAQMEADLKALQKKAIR